ncbi:hypothetical protein DSECCO2_512080 [anaerobic digester metagenome]
MKTNSKKNTFALVLILFTVLGCGRYEEGPCISFRSPERRLCGKKWHVVSFMKNDSDLTEQWKTNYDWRLYFQGHYDSGLGESTGLDVFNVSDNRVAFGGWCFDSDDPDGITANTTKILFGFYLVGQDSIISGIHPLITRSIGEYNILKLKHDELWLEHTDSVQNVYVIEFEYNQP